jgi:hypothetical protein
MYCFPPLRQEKGAKTGHGAFMRWIGWNELVGEEFDWDESFSGSADAGGVGVCVL